MKMTKNAHTSKGIYTFLATRQGYFFTGEVKLSLVKSFTFNLK